MTTLQRPRLRAEHDGGDTTTSAPFGSRLLGSAHQSTRALRLRVQVLLTLLLVGTNVIGAVVVFLVATFVAPQPLRARGMVLALAVGVPAYVVMAVVVGAVLGTRTTLRALRWATDEVEPDAAERDRALRVPLRLTQVQAGLWFGATVVFTVLSLALQPERALSSGLTIGIAGLVVCAIAYLLSEFTLRPIAARALARRPLETRLRGTGVGERMVIFWCLGTGAPTLGVAVAGVLTLAGAPGTSLQRLAVIVIVVAAVVLSFGLFVTVLNARSIVAPVLSVSQALHDVERGDLDREVVVFDGTELGLLQAGFNRMAGGLREREHLRDLFGRHVGEDVARAAAAGDVELGGETRVVSVLFVDLVGSTTFATEHDPAQVVEVLNRFFGVVVDEVDRRGGLVNKFIGDAVLAVFGAPVELDDHAEAALATARAVAARLGAEVPEIGFGVGVATGEAVAGNVGHQRRFEYTVIGDAVNSAARLTDLAKEAPGGVLVARASLERAPEGERQHWRPDGERTLRGRGEPTPVAVLDQEGLRAGS